ncbi:hypothetical protein FQA39_LY06368 [Lamprigera yunnana]|nr:hypothetical protein FQA39_LY06368 [Lamprigera yunnana]
MEGTIDRVLKLTLKLIKRKTFNQCDYKVELPNGQLFEVSINRYAYDVPPGYLHRGDQHSIYHHIIDYIRTLGTTKFLWIVFVYKREVPKPYYDFWKIFSMQSDLHVLLYERSQLEKTLFGYINVPVPLKILVIPKLENRNSNWTLPILPLLVKFRNSRFTSVTSST